MADEPSGLPRRLPTSAPPVLSGRDDPASLRRDVRTLAEALAALQREGETIYDVLAQRANDMLMSGTLANRPTVGVKDRVYYATDEPAGGNVFWDDGTTWQRLGVRQRTGTATWDPASVAAGAQVTTTVTVTGAALGDPVAVGFSLDLQGMQLTGYVSATNTVTCVLRNGTAGALDLASGTLRATVWSY